LPARRASPSIWQPRSDRILSALPLSFDAGFSQLTTAFLVGARVTLINYLLPREVLNAVVRERITGLTAVPALWIQLAQLAWPGGVSDHLRYNRQHRRAHARGDARPAARCAAEDAAVPDVRADRIVPLDVPAADEVDRRPDSIGKAIPNAEVLVVRPDGTPCAPGEPGELVHRGRWSRSATGTIPRRRPSDSGRRLASHPDSRCPRSRVWSGDTVRTDDEGYLYFISRRDEMIKTSGYRVSPTEVEEVVYATGLVGETAALGVPHPTLGQAIVVVATALDGRPVDIDRVLAECRQRLPAFMVPSRIEPRPAPLPRNPNGKIDRKLMASEMQDLFGHAT
jgi:acyl-CoA synthetase (AMP-forming)/AMP-acid ligase II